jgi:hypothetical protein
MRRVSRRDSIDRARRKIERIAVGRLRIASDYRTTSRPVMDGLRRFGPSPPNEARLDRPTSIVSAP